MITLVLVDLDNLLERWRMPDAGRVAAEIREALPRGPKSDGRDVVVVVGLNVRTACDCGGSWEDIVALASDAAQSVEARLRGRAPRRVEIEPVLMPSLPEAVDGALARLVRQAPSPGGAGRLGDVVLLGRDRGLRGRIGASLAARTWKQQQRVAWWRLDGPVHRAAPQVPRAHPSEPRTRPTQVVETLEHAAWAAARHAQHAPCDLRTAAWAIGSDPWLRTQLSVSEASVTGPARLRTVLSGEPAPLAVGTGEIVDYQLDAAASSSGGGARLYDVAPGTVRVRWGETGARVLSADLPFGLLVRAGPLPRPNDGSRVPSNAVLRRLEGKTLADPTWTVTFHRRPSGFHGEVDVTGGWPPVWWHRRRGMTAKLVGGALSTPRRIDRVPIRLHVAHGRLGVRSVAGAGLVHVERGGEPGDLVEATSAQGRCVVLCAERLDPGRVHCVPVQAVQPSWLGARLRALGDWLKDQGVLDLPILVTSVRSEPEETSRG